MMNLPLDVAILSSGKQPVNNQYFVIPALRETQNKLWLESRKSPKNKVIMVTGFPIIPYQVRDKVGNDINK